MVLKHQITAEDGVTDSNFVGEVKVILFNHSTKPCEVHVGDCIAQIIFERIEFPKVVEVNKLRNAERCNKGFDSTGK